MLVEESSASNSSGSTVSRHWDLALEILYSLRFRHDSEMVKQKSDSRHRGERCANSTALVLLLGRILAQEKRLKGLEEMDIEVGN